MLFPLFAPLSAVLFLLFTAAAAAAQSWTPPRTPDGQPDLQGIWTDNTVTPFERPKQFGDRGFLTDQEVSVLRQRAARLFDGSGDLAVGDELFLSLLANPDGVFRTTRPVGDYNHFWIDDGLVIDNRTSQVIDPPDGRLPPLTPEGRQKQAAAVEARRLHPADGPEDRTPGERCLTWGTARVGFLQQRNNSYHQIIETPAYVVIHSEMVHEARIIPIDGRPHADPALRFWSGDSRARWEGSSLVIDTTNFSHSTRPVLGLPVSGDHVHLIERLTPLDAETISYQVTIEDPTTWTRPWTAVTTWKRGTKRMFEYACHEANYGMTGILGGARAEERQK